LPYILYGEPFSFINAWFESVSGFTTTGSTILINIEILPQGLLFWRSSTHWIGGIGIIIFVLSVLPFLGMAEMILFRSEVSSLASENFHHRVGGMIHMIAGVYVGLTLLETILLLSFGMNFLLLFSVVKGNIADLWRSSVIRYYLLTMLFGSLLTTWNVHGEYFTSWTESFRHAAFNTISVGTSTGFSTTDTSIWPPLAHLLIIFFMFQCACAGSTSGGIKTDRIVLFGKSFLAHLKKIMHPNAVIPIRIDGNAIDDKLVSESILYICIYLLVVFISTLLLLLIGVDLTDAFSGTVATMGNVGPGLGTVGSTGNFSQLPALGKWILSLTMLLGRLEIYAFFIFFVPAQWKKTISY
jgi:trk system potassium uptake protein TrkH